MAIPDNSPARIFSRCSFASEEAVSNLMEYDGHYTFNADTFNKFNDAILKSESKGSNWSVKVSGGNLTLGGNPH